MGFLREIKKALFGARAVGRSASESTSKASEEFAREADDFLKKEREQLEAELRTSADQAEPSAHSPQEVPFEGEEKPYEPAPSTPAADNVPKEDEADMDSELDELFAEEDEPGLANASEELLEEKQAEAQEDPGPRHHSEEAERLRRQAEELGEDILERGNDALEGARALAGKLFDKASEFVERAQQEAAAELEEKQQAAEKLRKEIEQEAAEASDPTKNIFEANEDLLSEHEDFFERARRFAEGDYQNEAPKGGKGKMDIKKDPDYQGPEKKKGFVPGFEDLDGDGDEIIDDAILDLDPDED